MRSSTYLQLSKSNTYYFRLRVPLHLVAVIGRKEIHRSLKTSIYQEALVRAGRLLDASQQLFRSAINGTVNLAVLTWDFSPDKVDKKLLASPKVKPNTVPASPMFSVVVERYLAEQAREGVSEKTIADKRSICELFVRIVGNKAINSISRENARLFKETALKLPPRMGQLPKQAISKMIEGAEKTISLTTFNNYVKNLTTVFLYAVREDYCSKNPLEGLKVVQKVKANSHRARYSEEDLRKLFSALKSEESDPTKPYKKWLPILGLYTGARLNELCQLYLEDIVEVEGVHCIYVNAKHPDQKLKTLSSERLIPIHSKLIEQGFLEFVAKQRNLGNQRLFPELSLHKHNGYAAHPSRWFAGVRSKLGIETTSGKLDFHSFRHTVADHLKKEGISESLIGALLGHKTGGITFGRYGKDYDPESLITVVEKICYK